VLLAAIARPDRRFDRDGDGRAVVRRAGHRPRVRQEHAGQRHRDGPAESALVDGIRRHDSRRSRARQAARHHLGVPVLRGIPRRRDHRRPAARDRPPFLSGRRRVRRDVHGEHDGGGDRGARPVAALQFVHSGRGSGQGRRVPPGWGSGLCVAREGPEAARHPDAQGVRKCVDDDHGGRRIDQRRAASAGDCQGGRRAPRTRGFSARQRSGAAPRRLEAERQVRAGRFARWR
jgi:hypothetical protein